MNDHDNSRYIGAFGTLINALGGGGDRGNSFPASDADEMMNGARFIPGEVTLARRRGEQVQFVQNCGMCCWYWEMSDGTRIYHWERGTYESIHRANEKSEGEKAGPCPHCGNENTNGGTH